MYYNMDTTFLYLSTAEANVWFSGVAKMAIELNRVFLRSAKRTILYIRSNAFAVIHSAHLKHF